MAKKFTKFERPAQNQRRAFRLSPTDLDILSAVLRYRFLAASQLVRLVGRNHKATAARLRALWEYGHLSRFAFSDPRRFQSEFHYYLDSRSVLELLVAHGRLAEIHPAMENELRQNREADYARAGLDGASGQALFLRHELMISRCRYMLERAAWDSQGQVELPSFRRGGDLEGHKVEVPEIRSRKLPGSREPLWEESDETRALPVEPDALFTLRFPARPEGEREKHFAYEADRGTMSLSDMLRKFRAYYFFVKKHRRHIEAFGIHPIRAVLVETPSEARALKLMELAAHPLVSGPGKRAGLFWFVPSVPVFISPEGLPTYLDNPSVVFEPEWGRPEGLTGSGQVAEVSKHSLLDEEHAGPASSFPK